MSTLGLARAAEGAEVVFATNTGDRNFTARYLDRATADWFAEEDLGNRRGSSRVDGTTASVESGAREDGRGRDGGGAVCDAGRQGRRAGALARGCAENWESEIDKRMEARPLDDASVARRRLGIRPKGEHARPAASFFFGTVMNDGSTSRDVVTSKTK